MKHNILVSVIVPCYNHEQYLLEALDSVKLQSFKKWECVIVNDGSTDNSEEIALKFCKEDERFKYIKIENSGVCTARNVAINSAIGKYIIPLDSDDKIGKTFLEDAYNMIEIDPSIELIYTDIYVFGDLEKVLVLDDYSLPKLLAVNNFYNTCLYKKESFIRTGGYDINMNNGVEDWEFWISLLKNGGRAVKLKSEKPYYFYRYKNTSRHRNISSSNYKELLNYMSYKHAKVYIDNFGNFQEFSFYKSYYEKMQSSIIIRFYKLLKNVFKN